MASGSAGVQLPAAQGQPALWRAHPCVTSTPNQQSSEGERLIPVVFSPRILALQANEVGGIITQGCARQGAGCPCAAGNCAPAELKTDA